MKQIIISAALITGGCAQQAVDLRPQGAIQGLCSREQIDSTIVFNGRLGSPLGTVNGDVKITHTIVGQYISLSCDI